MRTNGRVLYNCHSVTKNGYDCFCNLSPSEKDVVMTVTMSWPVDWFPRFDNIPRLIKIDNTHTKFSNQSFYLQNTIGINLTNPYTKPCDYTVSFWGYQKIFDEYSIFSSENEAGSFAAGLYSNTSIMQALDNSQNPKSIQTRILLGNGTNYSGWNNTDISSLNLYLMNRWVHYAFTVKGSICRIFIDGTKISECNTNYNNDTNGFWIRNVGTYYWIDDLVCIVNECIWEDNFTPPTTYLLDNEYVLHTSKLKKENVIASNVDKDIIFTDISNNILKVY